MALSYKNDEQQDERLNPASLKKRENSFDDIVDNYDDTADDSVENDNISRAKTLEENPTHPNPMGYRGHNSQKTNDIKAKTKAIIRTRGPMGAIAAVILGGGVGITFFLGGAAAPMAFFANVTDDLNDQLAAMDIGQNHLLRNKVDGATRRQVAVGCTKLSIRCKFQTMGKSQIEAYRRAGIKVNGTEAFAGRTKPVSFEFKGKTYTAPEWINHLNTDTDARYASKRALNMKFMGFNDKTFIGRTLKRFGISRKPPELTGPHKDRVNVLMGKVGTTDIDGLHFSRVVDADGNEVLDSSGNPTWTLDGDPSGTAYTDAQKATMDTSINKIATARPPSRAVTASVKALSVIGYMDLACSIKNMIGAAGVAAKVSNSVSMAKYVMPLASLSGKMKAGEISSEDAEALIEVFNQTDSRTKIVDLDGDAQVGDDVVMKDNPNAGKSMMDSPLFKMASTGQREPMSSTEVQYSLGMGQNRLLSAVSGAASVANAMGDAVGCDFVQNGWVRGIGLIAGVALAVGTAGSNLAIQAATSVALIAATMILDTMLNNALQKTVVQEDIDQAPIERAAIGFGGISAISGESARSRGLMPGNADQIVDYLALRDQVNQDYIAIEKQDAKPFDIYNQYSFLGSFAQSIIKYTSSSRSITSIMGNMSSIVANAIPIAFGADVAQARTIDVDRFKQCDDQYYNDVGIDADVQCNVRYVMNNEDLALESDEVAVWMEEKGFVEADTETGYPAGYIPLDPAETQNFAESMINGAVSGIYNTRYFDGNEYAYFLDYCAYRSLPFGETFQESNAIGGINPDWITGKKCSEGGDVSYFRMYTLYKSIQSAEDDEPVDVYTSNAGTTTTAPNDGTLSTGWAKPVAGSKINTAYHNPFYRSKYGWAHEGVDLQNSFGNAVYSVCNGTIKHIIAAGTEDYGEETSSNTVVVDCGGGITSGYHHTPAIGGLSVGQAVTAGQQIGTSDCSGVCSGAHLHFNIKQNGEFINPRIFMLDKADIGTCSSGSSYCVEGP